MYCNSCQCEFNGWDEKCPICKSFLVEYPEPDSPPTDPGALKTFMEILRDRGGTIEIPVTTTKVSRVRKYAFPYRGHGYAWAKKMRGESWGMVADLTAVKVNSDKRYSFPYQG